MSEHILEYLEMSSGAINLFAVLVIIVGFTLAAGRYAFRYRKKTLDQNFSQFKVDLGSALTLGLEILILADVIETITVTPTYQSLGILAFLVVIRTLVSWTLILEIEGHWPWQGSAGDEAEQTNA